jgi:hypothetical protein
MVLKKAIGGLLVITGLLDLLLILIINSGHTSSYLSVSKDVSGIIIGILFITAGIYFVRNSTKK